MDQVEQNDTYEKIEKYRAMVRHYEQLAADHSGIGDRIFDLFTRSSIRDQCLAKAEANRRWIRELEEKL